MKFLKLIDLFEVLFVYVKWEHSTLVPTLTLTKWLFVRLFKAVFVSLINEMHLIFKNITFNFFIFSTWQCDSRSLSWHISLQCDPQSMSWHIILQRDSHLFSWHIILQYDPQSLLWQSFVTPKLWFGWNPT